MATMTQGPGDGIRYAVKKFSKKVKSAISQKKIKKIMEGKEKEANQNRLQTKQDRILERNENKMEREVERGRRRNRRKMNRAKASENIKEAFGNIGEYIKDKVDDMRTNAAQRRYKKGKGPRGERSSESGGVSDDQVCGPDGCKTGPAGTTVKKGKKL